jgi:hypothetical protein
MRLLLCGLHNAHGEERTTIKTPFAFLMNDQTN